MSEKIKAEVREQLLATLAANNSGDVDTFLQHFDPEGDGFEPDSGLLQEEFDRDALKAQADAGQLPQMQFRQIGVKLYGDTTAVATAYVAGKHIRHYRK